MAKKDIESKVESIISKSVTFNPLLNALRENDKKNLFKSNALSYYHKTGFPLIDYYFGSVINVHNDLGEIIRQEPMIGQAAGTFNVVLANSGAGKAQPVSTVIPTPGGCKLMGELKVGDEVFDRYGKPTIVTGVFDKGLRKIYKVKFQDGRIAECCDEHLWAVKKRKDDTYKVLSLREIMSERSNYSLLGYQIPSLVNPVRYESKPVPVDPYTLGVILSYGLHQDYELSIKGDTDFIANKLCDLNGWYNNEDIPEVFNFYKDNTMTERVMIDEILLELPEFTDLEQENVYIPDIYLHNDVIIRMELLRGLMDASGHISKKHDNYFVKYYANSRKLTECIQKLLWGLGYSTSKLILADIGAYIRINIPNNQIGRASCRERV